jgi:hypothetical protein
MKKLLAVAAVASVTAFAAPAFAETSASIGWSQYSIVDLDLDAVTGHYSWRSEAAGGHFGVELEGAFGMGDDKAGTAPNQTVVAMRSSLGVFATAQANVADNFTIFGRVGLSSVNVTERNRNTNTHISDNAGGMAYGVGAIWWFKETSGVRLDYSVYNVDLGHNLPPIGNPASFSDEDPSAITVSYVHKFGAAAAPAP